jgi:hypothetical protein
MGSLKKYLVIGFAVLLLIILFVGFLALSEPYIKGLSKSDLFNQSNQTDLIVSVSENFLILFCNRSLKNAGLKVSGTRQFS